MKLFYFDLETTGLDPKKNAIHQIAGEIEIDGKTVEKFNWRVRPHDGAVIEEEALAFAGVTREKIMGYAKTEDVFEELEYLLIRHGNSNDKQDKFHLVGYNNCFFDNQFLRAFFMRNSQMYLHFGSWFWSDSIDVMALASNYLKSERHEMQNFQLKTVAMHLGVEVDDSKLHDAEYDIYLTKKIYEKITHRNTPQDERVGIHVDIKPMSVNEAWKGQRYKTDAYMQYTQDLMWLLPKLVIPQPPYEVRFEFGFSSTLSDWDNPVKPTQDVLCRKYGFDDRDIVRAVVDTVKVPKGKEYFKFEIMTKK